MKVTIKEFDVEMELKNNGMELEVKNNQRQHLGDICIGKAKIEWCPGRTRRGHGITKTWEELIALF